MPIDLAELDIDAILAERLEVAWIPYLKKPVSGAYRNETPAEYGSILELRVDVDGRRPQDRLSGDLYTHFTFCGIPVTLYTGSFVVEDVGEESNDSSITLTGPVVYYADPSNTADSIKATIPRVGYYSKPAAACVDWYTNGSLVRSYVCPKISPYFRTATLEIDRFQGTSFPPALDPDIDPSPAGLPSSVSVASVFERSGIDLNVTHDDILNDPDSADPGNNWSEAELHDLMEDRFDSFANRLQWELYGVIVPRFGDPAYNSGYYGTMFDFGGWQPGDTHLRQGWAIAEDATRGRVVDSLYDSAAKKDRLVLQTTIHEIGHAFNLPHTWQRANSMDTGSESFMNYPWRYTDDGGQEEDFWENFRWEFDDVELVWMRHADRNDIIFGGRDWVWNNLSVDPRPGLEYGAPPATLTIDSPRIFDAGVPVEVELELQNTTGVPIRVVDRLEPEEGMLRVLIRRPNGDVVEFVPPLRRLLAPPKLKKLAPGKAISSGIGLSVGAKGNQFIEPGEYHITVFYPCWPIGYVATASHRIRIASPRTRQSEELAYLLSGRDAAQFLYYGGSRRDARLTEQLANAVERFAETDPVAVRHISAALGRDAARVHKRVVQHRGRSVIDAKAPKPREAVERLTAAIAPLPEAYGRVSAFVPDSEALLAEKLTDVYVSVGERDEAIGVLDDVAARLRQQQGPRATVKRLKRRADVLKRDGVE